MGIAAPFFSLKYFSALAVLNLFAAVSFVFLFLSEFKLRGAAFRRGFAFKIRTYHGQTQKWLDLVDIRVLEASIDAEYRGMCIL